MQKRETLVVIPAKNEERTIGDIIARVKTGYGFHVLVVNDASQDMTPSRAREAGAEVLNLVNPLGAWCATQTGIRHALRQGYRRVVTMDADGQHPIEGIPQIVGPVERGEADVVIGSCLKRGSSLRKAAWLMFRFVGALKVADLTSGFRCYSRPAMEILATREATLLDYQDIGVLFLLLEADMAIKEVEIDMCQRLNGHSRIFNTWLAVGEYMLLSSVLAVSKNLYRNKMGRSGK